jgi:hypothetical protein
VTHFLIVNPPKWFGKVYAIMRKMLSPEFQKKVHMIPVGKLDWLLQLGYEDYLPSELGGGGRASTADLVKDYCNYCQYVESQQEERPLLVDGRLRQSKSLKDNSQHTIHSLAFYDETTESGSSSLELCSSSPVIAQSLVVTDKCTTNIGAPTCCLFGTDSKLPTSSF